MSSKIDPASPDAVGARAGSTPVAPAPAAGRGRDPVPASAPADSIKLTGEAVSLQRLERALRNGGTTFDAQRVEQVRSALAAGTYKIDSAAIAGKLVELERLLSKQG